MHEAKMIDCTVKNVFNSFFFVLCVVAAKRRNTISVVSRVSSQVLKANKKTSIKKKDFLEFSAKQDEMIELKKKQNEIFLKIYTLLGKEI